ncbi:hypothetical protein, partial [Acetobacter okinawensis]|uniref:hypothetical protein n=1 Tax=Acetobacter okinawensis TaxID=1076594 RepID=UPI001BAE0BA1
RSCASPRVTIGGNLIHAPVNRNSGSAKDNNIKHKRLSEQKSRQGAGRLGTTHLTAEEGDPSLIFFDRRHSC